MDISFVTPKILQSVLKHFETPCYLYSQTLLQKNCMRLRQAFAPWVPEFFYAIKANPNLALLQTIQQTGFGFEAVSLGELMRTEIIGTAKSQRIFSGVGKQTSEIQQALQMGIHSFHVESLPELHRIQEIAHSMDCVANIAIRVNPQINAHTHPYISTALAHSKFGLEPTQALKAYEIAKDLSHINLSGISCHLGSQITELTPFIDAVSFLKQMLKQLKQMGINLDYLSLGGGLGVCYTNETPPSIESYATAIQNHLSPHNIKLYLEPGRVLVANTGLLLMRVEYIKQTPHKYFAIVNAAMNDFIRPALYQAKHAIVPIKTASQSNKQITYDVVGPVCESSDCFASNVTLPELQAGDLLAITNVGAYATSMESNYNSRLRCAEIMVGNDTIALIRKKETFEQMMQNERLATLEDSVAYEY